MSLEGGFGAPNERRGGRRRRTERPSLGRADSESHRANPDVARRTSTETEAAANVHAVETRAPAAVRPAEATRPAQEALRQIPQQQNTAEAHSPQTETQKRPASFTAVDAVQGLGKGAIGFTSAVGAPAVSGMGMIGMIGVGLFAAVGTFAAKISKKISNYVFSWAPINDFLGPFIDFKKLGLGGGGGGHGHGGGHDHGGGGGGDHGHDKKHGDHGGHGKKDDHGH